MRAYEGEIFRRDSELLKKEAKIGTMSSQLDELRRMSQKGVTGKMTSRVADELEVANRIIKDKN